MYSDKCLEVFLKEQGKLFPKPVAETKEEAADFLDMMFAVVCKNMKEVKEYLDDEMDITGLSLKEIEELEEVFVIGDGTFLIVQG